MTNDPLDEEAAPFDEAELPARNRRVIEALLFGASEPLSVEQLKPFVSDGADIKALLEELRVDYAARGVNLVRRDDKWAMRTADDLGFLLRREETQTRPLSRAAVETLSIIAYHQPVTRADIDDIRGVEGGKSTLDLLMDAGFIRMRGRRRTPGRPVTYGTTDYFLDHFGLESLGDLPGLDDLKGAGLLSSRVPANLQIPIPFDGALADDEDPLEDGEEDDDAFAAELRDAGGDKI